MRTRYHFSTNLGDAVHDLSDKVRSDVGSLGVDTTSHTAEHRDRGPTQPVAGHCVHHDLVALHLQRVTSQPIRRKGQGVTWTNDAFE